MAKPHRKREVILLAVFLPLVTGGYLYAQSDLNAMESALEAQAETRRAEWFSSDAMDPDAFHTVTLVDSYKTLTFFGEGRGTIHIYSVRKDDPALETFMGVEYHYVRGDDGAWRMTDSAGCEAIEHHKNALDALRDRGVDISEEVYERAAHHGAHEH